MVSLQELTVAQVSGLIAAAVFVVQFLVPIALPVILLGLLRPRSKNVTETAVSWSVIARYLHSSLWPLILQTDSAATTSACKSILFMSFFKTFMLLLIAVSAIVTPLGLYEGIVAEPAAAVDTFHYIKDPTPMGYGTPPRGNNTWSRLCGYFLIVPCPNDNNNATLNVNTPPISITYTRDWYDTRVPQNVVDVFQSGAAEIGDSVSSSFDIQYRSYVKAVIDDVKRKTTGPMIDNGTARTVGTYQPLSNLVLNDDILAVEGLIVDMKNGGIGFRNHSAPTLSKYGSTWDEDLLFIVPDTVCVDTNLTFDFKIARTRTEQGLAKNGIIMTEIVDHGGFINLNTTYPLWNLEDTQADPLLWYRAYRSAWFTNFYTMAYMNVTNVTNKTLNVSAFSYLNSTMGKTFPLYFPDGKTAVSDVSTNPNSLTVSTNFGDFLAGTEGYSNQSTIGNETTTYNFTATLPIYPNPFKIDRKIWASIDTLCRRQGGGDFANITNIMSKCGYLYGAPIRKDDSSSSLFDPGSAWSLPMYSCVSMTKSIIKTASFRFNGTKDDLSGLVVVSLKDKIYPNDESKPLWGVEQSDMTLSDGGPLWGLISKDKETKLNISTVRKESLYLPGRGPSISSSNTPGADFAAIALQMTYETGSSSLYSPTRPIVDYSGRANLAMYKKWQELSQDPKTSAKILNLIWTDIAANMVVGTKGLQPQEGEKRKRDGAQVGGAKTPQVIKYTRRIKYAYVYAIPAFLALILFVASLMLTLFFMFTGANPSTMRTFLQHTSVGRLLISQDSDAQSTSTSYGGHSLMPHKDEDAVPTTDVWAKGAGQQQFALVPDGWIKNKQLVPGYEAKGGMTASYTPVPNSQVY